MAATGFRTTELFLCDKNIFKPHNFLPASEDTDVAPVNHSALVKTSDQPSFSSANFSPFTSAEALRASDISLVPSLNLCCSIIVVLFYVLFVSYRSMYCLCVNVYCTTATG
jgi:hypothetical protein